VFSSAPTLGQLVAAEHILSAVFLSMAQVSSLLEKFDELRAALLKLGASFEFPLEQPVLQAPIPAAPAGRGLRGAVTADRAREFRFDCVLPARAMAMVVVDSFSLQKGLIDLLLRHAEPTRGTVLPGEANLADLDVHALYDAIVVVANTEVLQNGLEENLALDAPTVTRAAMRNMLGVADLTRVLAALPAGLETPLSACGYPRSRF
jgi:ABC-type bacteriocin/lantibiotic exporter with double-glycine peptidase domain